MITTIRDLRGSRVLITGAASGIGRACAHAFAREGANLVVSDVDVGGLEGLVSELDPIGVDCIALPCNIASEDDVASFAGQVLEKTGSVDVLINNAGIGYLGPFVDTPVSAWRRVLDIDVLGIVHVTRAFLPSMLADKDPKAILNVASTAGFAPAASMAAYAAAKHAVVGLSEVLAMELVDTNVTVTIVAPGIVNTNIVKGRGNIAESINDEQISRLQAYYDKNGCDASIVARDMVGAVKSGKALLATGPFARLLYTMMRLSRPLARRVSIASSKKIGFL